MDTTRNTAPTLHPALLIAAASVTTLSLAGVGVLTGVLPFNGKTATTVQPQAALVQPAATAPTLITPTASAPVPTVSVNIANAPPPAQTTRVATAKPANAKPVRVANAQGSSDIDVYRYDRPPVQMRQAEPVATPVAAPMAARACADCGTIESVREATMEPEASGVGAIAGGVLGGVLGNQVGNGRGRDLATVVGAIGGAVAGNQIEKKQKRVTQYEVTVRFEDGTSRIFTQEAAPGWRSGDRVKIVNGQITSRV